MPALVIAHRGASGYRPEHTLASYRLAIAQGADFIEPDLVATSDGVLIARHENALATVKLDSGNTVVLADGQPIVLEETTNVATLPKFDDRLTVKMVDGVTVGGWFSEDFTLVEIKELRARERIPEIRPANARFNDRFLIPTLGEVIALVRQAEAATGRRIGIYPETKHPTYFKTEGRHRDGTPIAIDLTRKLVGTLVAECFTDPARVFIQSFEIGNLQELREEIMPKATIRVPLVQLLGDDGERPYDLAARGDPRTYGDLMGVDGLAEIARYADAIGPSKMSIAGRDEDDDLLAPGSLVADAHRAGLLVHPYTFRAENAFLPMRFRIGSEPTAVGDGAGEIATYLATGIDAFFTDHPALGRNALARVAPTPQALRGRS